VIVLWGVEEDDKAGRPPLGRRIGGEVGWPVRIDVTGGDRAGAGASEVFLLLFELACWGSLDAFEVGQADGGGANYQTRHHHLPG
jgi:hypothetical protein